MARKPIDQEAAAGKGKSYGRQAMWDAMREKREFTVEMLAFASNRHKASVGDYLKRLLAAGIIEECGTKPLTLNPGSRFQQKVYRLVNDIGNLAPRLTAEGKPLIEARDQMWRTMKMLSSFNAVDLAAAASTEECAVSPVDARDYCAHLLKAGYLIVMREATYNSKTVYRLRPSMNTGPHAPKVQRTKLVFDPNRQEVMWHEEIEP